MSKTGIPLDTGRKNPEGPVFLHPADHPWLKPLGGQRSVDDVGDFPPGTVLGDPHSDGLS